MRKLLFPFTVIAWDWLLSIVSGASGRSGSELSRLIVNRLSDAFYPGSLGGMLNETVFAAAFVVASIIA